jgi:hypothetical protein
MMVSLGFKPFNDYWITCYYNKIFTILTSIDSSYKLAAYLNDYHYDVQLWGATNEKNAPLYNHLVQQPFKMFKEQYLQGLFIYQPIRFREEENFLDILKNHIRQKEIVQVGIDLFYWLPDSMNFGVNHWNHTAVLNGYDDEKKVFYAFDADNSGFDEQEIPEDRFLLAIKSCVLDTHGDILKLADQFHPYQFSLSDVVINAKRLIDEISTMNTDSFWLLTDDDFDKGRRRDIIAIQIFQIASRHIGNGLLFQRVLNEYCDNDIIENLVQRSKKLQDGWLIARSKLLIIYRSKTDRWKQLASLNEDIKCLFNDELEMWDSVIKNIKLL